MTSQNQLLSTTMGMRRSRESVPHLQVVVHMGWVLVVSAWRGVTTPEVTWAQMRATRSQEEDTATHLEEV